MPINVKGKHFGNSSAVTFKTDARVFHKWVIVLMRGEQIVPSRAVYTGGS